VRTKGNPNWGKGIEIPNLPTSFDEVVRRLRLSVKDYETSAPLKEWVQKHKDSRYVPQDLLKAWGFVEKL